MQQEKLCEVLHGITVFIGTTISWSTTFQTIISFGVYYPDIIDHFRADPRIISCIIAVNNLIGIFAGMVGGEMNRRFGYRVSGITACACVAAGLCVAMVGNHVTWLFIGFGIITGTGMAFSIQSTHFAIQTVFPQKRATMSGIIGFLMLVLTMPWPMLVRLMIDTYGWRGSMLIQAGICIQAIPFIMLMKVFAKPEGRHKVPTQQEGNAKKENFHTCATGFIQRAFSITLLRDWRISLFYTAGFLLQIGVGVTYNLTVIRSIWLGETKFNASFLMTLFCIGNAAGRLLGGIVGDHVDRVGLCSFNTFLVGLTINIAAFLNGYTANCILACLIGISTGGAIVSYLTCLSSVTGEENLSKALGFFIVTIGLGGGIGPTLGELVMNITGSYNAAFNVTGCIVSLSSICFMIVTIAVRLRKKKLQEYHCANIPEMHELAHTVPVPPKLSNDVIRSSTAEERVACV